MKVGLVLEGGAMRGLYTAGVIDTFLKEKIDVDTIIGVSAGALFGMNYKSKQIGRVLRYNKAYVGNKDYMGVYSFLKTGNVMNEEFCFEKLIDDLDPIDYQSYQESPVDFYAVVTNLQTGKAEYKLLDTLDNYDQVEYLRASGSMPFVSHIIQVNGHEYLDGGCSDSIPIKKMLEMDVDKIIVVLTRPLDYRKKPSNKHLNKLFYHQYPHFVETLNNRYLNYNASLDLITKLEKEKKKLTKELSEGLLDLDSEKTELILELKREFSTYNKETKRLKAKRNSLSDNLAGVKTITKKDIEQIQKFFPEVDLVQIQKIENFHKEINRVLNQEIKDELLNIEKTMNVLEMEKDKISIKISEITNTENFSKVILFKYAEIQKEIEMRLKMNFMTRKSYLKKRKMMLKKEKKK